MTFQWPQEVVEKVESTVAAVRAGERASLNPMKWTDAAQVMLDAIAPDVEALVDAAVEVLESISILDRRNAHEEMRIVLARWRQEKP